MEWLPAEILNEILLLVDRPSLYHVSQVCNQWRQMSLKQIVVINSLDIFKATCYRGDHLSIIKSKKNELWLNQGFRSACKGGHKELAELMIIKGADDYNIGLYNTCRGGHKELVELMIIKGASDWNRARNAGRQGGHQELVELMIPKC